MGNSQPRVNGGMSINLRYKSLSLFTSFSFLLRRDIINKVLADNFKSFNNPNVSGDGLQGSAALAPIGAYDFWTPTNVHADYPNPYDYQHSSVIDPFRADQTLFMEDGSYFKINAITLRIPCLKMDGLHSYSLCKYPYEFDEYIYVLKIFRYQSGECEQSRLGYIGRLSQCAYVLHGTEYRFVSMYI